MKLVNLEEKDFREYALNHEQNNFHQTIEWGLLKEKNGWKMSLLGLVDGTGIKAACMILMKKTPVGNIFYSPRGFLIDYSDKKTLQIFTEEIRKYSKERKGIFIKIDPYVKHKQRDINSNIVHGGFDNSSYIENLKELGYKHTGFNIHFENLQPRWLFSIDLIGKNSEQILLNMEPETRRLIRKNIKLNLVTKELKDIDLKKFKDIMTHTSERRMFIDRPFSYYKDIYEVLSKNNMIKFMVTELDTELSLKSLEEEIEIENGSIKDKEDKIKNNAKINVDKTLKQIEISKNNLKLLTDRKKEIIDLKENFGDKVVLGGILYITYGSEILALFGGSYKEFMSYHSFYTTNYEMINYAIENGYKTYNFYGISGDFNKDSSHYGLYAFKRGFGGEVVELIGEFDLIISKPKMLMYKIAMKIYSSLKSLKLRIKKG